MENNELEKENEISRSEFAKKLALTATALLGVNILANNTKAQSANSAVPNDNISTSDKAISNFKEHYIKENFSSYNYNIEKKEKASIKEDLVSKESSKQKEANKYDTLKFEDKNLDKIKTIINNKNYEIKFSKNNKLLIDKSIFATEQDIDIACLSTQVSLDENILNKLIKEFNSLKVEELLNEAIEIVERCITYKNEWNDKAWKLFMLFLEIREAQLLDNNLLEQAEKGVYQKDYESAMVTKEAEQVNVEKIQEEIKILKDNILGILFSDNLLNLKHYNTIKSSYASNFYNGFFADIELDKNPGKFISQSHPYPHKMSFPAFSGKSDIYDNTNSITDIPANIVAGAASEFTKFEHYFQKAINEIELHRKERELSICLGRLTNAISNENYEKLNVEWKKKRDNIIRETRLLKKQAIIAEDGILNLSKELNALKEVYQSEIHEAYARMLVLKESLAAIYNISFIPPKISSSVNIDFLDKCNIVIRKSINEVNRFSQTESFSKFTISIRNQMSSLSKFYENFATGIWKFEVSDKLFKGIYNTRLRGINIQMINLNKEYLNAKLDGLISAQIKMPTNSIYIHKDGTRKSIQAARQSIFINRVFSSENSSLTDVFGGNSIINASPLGEWEVELNFASRPFLYKVENNKTKIVKLTTENNDFNSSDLRKINAEIQNQKKENLENNYSNYPRFAQNDFFDIQVDLLIAYKD